jgi:hypothetical protein
VCLHSWFPLVPNLFLWIGKHGTLCFSRFCAAVEFLFKYNSVMFCHPFRHGHGLPTVSHMFHLHCDIWWNVLPTTGADWFFSRVGGSRWHGVHKALFVCHKWPLCWTNIITKGPHASWIILCGENHIHTRTGWHLTL